MKSWWYPEPGLCALLRAISCAVAICLAVFLLPGCGSDREQSATDGQSAQASRGSGASSRAARGKDAAGKRLATSFARSGAPTASAQVDSQQAVARVLATVRRSAEYRPTLVVWLLDISPSAMAWGRVLHGAIRDFYTDQVPLQRDASSFQLESSVWTISDSVQTLVPRTDDAAQIGQALANLAGGTSSQELTFTAVEQALQQYLSVRAEERKELLFVIVTDEAGDDWSRVDQLVQLPRKYSIPFYVIGVPAPFGRRAALSADVESAAGRTATASDQAGPILQGPESRALERIQLKLPGYEADLELMDSGFGPFALQWLCRSSGGQFLAVRSLAERDASFDTRRMNWPAIGLKVPDPQVMCRYRPAPLSASAYQAALAGNQALMALHRAAQLPTTDVLRDPQLTFLKRNEADLKNQLDRAQQAAAKVAPGIDQLYELLREGAPDAPHLDQPRWQAGFDLALGRVCAAKARNDGYNSMLAALKRGRNFQDQQSTTWVLQRADSTDLNSSLQKLIERAKSLLQGVVDQHPNTPWADIAQAELAEPMGWQWAEQR